MSGTETEPVSETATETEKVSESILRCVSSKFRGKKMIFWVILIDELRCVLLRLSEKNVIFWVILSDESRCVFSRFRGEKCDFLGDFK